MCWSLEVLPNVLVIGVTSHCVGHWSYCRMCWSLELLPNVLVIGVTSHCVGHWSYFPLCWSLELFLTLLAPAVTAHCELVLSSLWRWCFGILSLYDELDYCILCAVRFTRPVTACWMWSQFKKQAYDFLRPVTWLCRHFLSLLATHDELSVTWTSTRKQQIIVLLPERGGCHFSTNSKNCFNP